METVKFVTLVTRVLITETLPTEAFFLGDIAPPLDIGDGPTCRSKINYAAFERLFLYQGKAIVEMLRLKEEEKGPFLVVCPLSVCDHWITEVTRFSCGTLSPIGYFGSEPERADVLKSMKEL
ncbi:hypothetical protein OSTOST_00977 [Ostertagia ostertagi]